MFIEKDSGKHAQVAAINWEEGERLDYVTIAKAGGRRGIDELALAN